MAASPSFANLGFEIKESPAGFSLIAPRLLSQRRSATGK